MPLLQMGRGNTPCATMAVSLESMLGEINPCVDGWRIRPAGLGTGWQTGWQGHNPTSVIPRIEPDDTSPYGNQSKVEKGTLMNTHCRNSLIQLLCLLATLFPAAASVAAAPGMSYGAVVDHLQTDDLQNPLGLDDAVPHFSWQIQDTRIGARQTAYRIQIASSELRLRQDKADIWDSGRIASSESVDVAYTGPILKSMTRYWWRVQLWDKDGHPLEPSQPTWWETGLMHPLAVARQHGVQWIGWQTEEERELRSANAAWITSPDAKVLLPAKATQEILTYHSAFAVPHPIRSAVLFVAGEDTVAVWVNGHAIAQAAAMPLWRQFPWRKYQRLEITAAVHAGRNQLVIETVHYVSPQSKPASYSPVPMSATLLVTDTSGTTISSATTDNGHWMVRASADTHDSAATTAADGWKPAIRFAGTEAAKRMDEPLHKPWPTETVKILRHTFSVHEPIVSARLYATALGAYTFWVNGHRAGNEILAPGWTDYRERIVYQTYDVTADLVQGRNALAAEVAPGWYDTPLQWFQQPNNYGLTPPSVAAMLHLQFANGTDAWVVTDASWKAARSSILTSEIYDGEAQDARMEIPGWQTPAFVEDAHWHSAEVHEPSMADVRVIAQDFPPIRVERFLKAQSVTEPKPGVYIYDFGQNFSGVERLALHGKRGSTVRVRTGEIVNADGTLYTDNLRTAKSTDTFILNGNGTEIFQPRYTFHGFRYLEITGTEARLPLEAVTGVVFHTDAPFSVQLRTANPMIQKLWSNILWGQRSNFVGVPTDCPQRDERLGWAADAQVFWRAASYNMQIASFSRKFSRDLRGTQLGSAAGTPVAGDIYGIFAPGVTSTASQSGAGWSDAGILIPWTSWLQTGDTSILQQNWAAMTRYLDAIEQTNPDFLWKNNAGIAFGDWLSPEGPTRFPLVATAYWAYDVTRMEQMAHALGKTDAEKHYAELFLKIRAAYQAAFVHEDGFVAGASPHGSGMAVNNPGLVAHGADTQTGYVLTLAMHLVPDQMRARVADHLAAKIHANHDLLGTGFLGTPYLLAVLADNGYADLAYHLLLNTQYPSWGYLVDHGATTMWERWNGDHMKDDPSMNSYNHYAYGAVADWIYRYAAGVDATPMDAGFHTVLLHPVFSERLGSLDLRYASPYGEIHSAWSVSHGTALWTITLPANTTGKLELSSTEIKQYRINGKTLHTAAADQKSGITVQPAMQSTATGRVSILLQAGHYSFLVQGISRQD